MRFGDKIIKISKDSILKRSIVDPAFINDVLRLSIESDNFIEIKQSDLIQIQKNKVNVTSLEKLNSFIRSSISWMRSGFNVIDNFNLNKRFQICITCEFWDKNSFRGTGKCNKCGCSTWAKLRMATERCPIGKWEAVDKDKIIVEQDK